MLNKDKILTAVEGQSLTSIQDPNLGFTKVLFNYPNPFKNDTSLEFELTANTKVDLEIFDLKENLIKTLLKQSLCQGRQIINWDGKNNTGKKISPTIYLLILKTKYHTTSKMIVFIK